MFGCGDCVVARGADGCPGAPRRPGRRGLQGGPTTAPLTVQFALKRDIGTVQTIDYGDGTSTSVSDFICGFQYCTRMHIYSRPGVYIVSLQDAGGQALRSLTVTVTKAS